MASYPMQMMPTGMPPTPDKTEGGELMPADYKMPVIDIDPVRLHAQKKVDFSDESEVLKYVRANRWLSLDIGGVRLLRMNWVVFTIASTVLWAFIIAVLGSQCDPEKDPEGCPSANPALDEFKKWQGWITQNFTWLYIGTQWAWGLFVVWIGLSKYGTLKLGKDNEKPIFNDITWFSMLFCSGIGVGLYFYGVSEPMYYYRLSYENKLYKVPFQNDDQRAQQAIFITLYHWGVHAWGCYILVALLLGFVAFRWDMPMTLRSAFYPLVGDVVHGLLGDLIDSISMACTTFGVCTSLGFGVDVILAGLRRLDCGRNSWECDSAVPADDGSTEALNWKIGIILIITFLATFSVVTGLRSGLKTFSQITFTLGNILLFSLLFLDNTWFLLNSYVQSLGHYLQYVVMVGFQCDTWEQLNLEFTVGASNYLWDAGPNRLIDPLMKATGTAAEDWPSPDAFFGSHNKSWIDWWTIFYWGWWVSWAPFVGMFIAAISRGRTIRQVVFGAFAAPIVYSFFFLIVLGSLGIKMERAAELALNVAPDIDKGMVDCVAMGYAGNAPNSTAAKGLAMAGYFPLACRSHPDRLFDVLSPYGEEIFYFLGIVTVIGVTLYFVTSSDSGSFVDDTLSAGGMLHCPYPQRVYWAFTEGACAIALMVAGGSNAVKALQAVSIVSGFPLTMAISYMCAALLRAVKYDTMDPEIHSATRFITGLFDSFEGFRPNVKCATPLPTVSERVTSLAISVFAPFVTMHAMHTKLYGTASGSAHTAMMACLFVSWIGAMFGELNAPLASFIGWVCYNFMCVQMCFIRVKAREAYNVYGFWLEDYFACLVMYPFVASQLSMQAQALDPVVDINADPNAHMEDSSPPPVANVHMAQALPPSTHAAMPINMPQYPPMGMLGMPMNQPSGFAMMPGGMPMQGYPGY